MLKKILFKNIFKHFIKPCYFKNNKTLKENWHRYILYLRQKKFQIIAKNSNWH